MILLYVTELFFWCEFFLALVAVCNKTATHHLQRAARSCLASMLLQGLEGLSDLRLLSQSLPRDSASGRISERDTVRLQDPSTGIRLVRQLQVTDHCVLSCESAHADNALVGLLGHVAVHVAVTVVDTGKGLGTLAAGVGAVGVVGQTMGLEVVGTAEGSAAVLDVADVTLLGPLYKGAHRLGAVIVDVVQSILRGGTVGREPLAIEVHA